MERNQGLSVILEEHGLSARNVYDLGRAADTVFDVRKIRSGQAYAFFTTRDSLPEPAFFVYEEDAKSYVVFDLRGDYRVYRGENPV